MVFSSLNHALADSLVPGRMGHQLGAGTLAADLDAISAAVARPEDWRPQLETLNDLLEDSSEASLLEHWRQALVAVNQHWDRVLAGEPALKAPPLWRLRLKSKLRPIGSLAGRLRP